MKMNSVFEESEKRTQAVNRLRSSLKKLAESDLQKGRKCFLEWVAGKEDSELLIVEVYAIREARLQFHSDHADGTLAEWVASRALCRMGGDFDDFWREVSGVETVDISDAFARGFMFEASLLYEASLLCEAGATAEESKAT